MLSALSCRNVYNFLETKFRDVIDFKIKIYYFYSKTWEKNNVY